MTSTTDSMGSSNMMSKLVLDIHPLLLIGVAIFLIIFCAAYYVIQSGLFTKIEIKTVQPKRGTMVVAYKTAKGPYKGAGELFTEACCLVLHREHIGIYYDDPEAVDPPDLRYAVGIILSSGAEQPDTKEMELLISNGYKIIILPRPNHVVMTTFPFKNTLSIYMGIFRVYPKLKEYITERGLCAYPALEIYTSKSIEFIMPLSKQEEFFVPEFCEEQVSIATTEFSTHADQDQDDDHKNTKDDDKVFVRPSVPKQQVKDLRKATLNNVNGDDSNSSISDSDFVRVSNSQNEENEGI